MLSWILLSLKNICSRLYFLAVAELTKQFNTALFKLLGMAIDVT